MIPLTRAIPERIRSGYDNELYKSTLLTASRSIQSIFAQPTRARVPNARTDRHIDTKTTLRATSVAACRRRGLKKITSAEHSSMLALLSACLPATTALLLQRSLKWHYINTF